MIFRIAMKEFYINLISARFVIGFVLCLILIPVSVLTGIKAYQGRVNTYEIERQQAESSKDVEVWGEYRPEIAKPPEPLSIFSSGINGNVGNKVKIYFGELPIFSTGKVTVRDNPFLNGIFSLDFTTVLAILMSLLAFIFSYDACTGEKEEGTLKLMLTNPLSRSIVLAGKGLGIVLTMLPPLIICYLLGALIIIAYPGISLSAAEWTRVILLAAVSLVYFGVFVALGLFISSRNQSSVTSIVVCLLVWVMLVFMIPNGASYAARSFVKIPSKENLEFELKKIDQERDKKIDEILYTPLPCMYLVHHTESSWVDGSFEIYGGTSENYEHWRGIFEKTEPIRLDYADRKWPLQQHYLAELRYQAHVARYIGMVSPFQLFKLTADALCRTDGESHDSFMEAARRYRETVLNYFHDKKAFGSYRWITPVDPKDFPTAEEFAVYTTGGLCKNYDEFVKWNDENGGQFWKICTNWKPEWLEHNKLDLSDAPVFEWKQDTINDSISKSIGNLGGMAIGMVLLFFLSFVSFTRYDVR